MKEDISSLAQWLEEKCRQQNLSLRRMSIKTGLSHTTIAVIVKGGRISVDSIAKLAEAFSGNGVRQKLALEDELLVMAGYRTPRPEEAENNQPMAQLMDAISEFSRSQLKLMLCFAEFLGETAVKAGQKKVMKKYLKFLDVVMLP